mmetsp:Transcript_42428/g.92778  ORF Transcript_42428/g.92778 Transcript_42428/m.92778 type:complete len:239 (-) Transcript_42428:235-951(-)
MQYADWSCGKIAHQIFRRDWTVFGLFRYTPLISRRQRYAILSTVILFSAFLSVLLFRDECTQKPKPKSCIKKTFFDTLFSYAVIFASLWGVVLSTPIPMLLILLFKKRVIHNTMTAEEKATTIRIWIIRARVGWSIVICIQSLCLFFLFSFVRHYPWTVIEKWLIATFLGLFHRFFSAPFIRMAWILVLLACSTYTSLCDGCLIMQPGLTTFTAPLGFSGVHERDEAEEDADFDLFGD